MSAAKKPPPQTDLAAEERRARVARVRAVAKDELAMIEKALLDVQARLPKVISDVQKARQVIDSNTTAPNGGEAS